MDVFMYRKTLAHAKCHPALGDSLNFSRGTKATKIRLLFVKLKVLQSQFSPSVFALDLTIKVLKPYNVDYC